MRDWLTGAIDLHVHSGPDVMERIGTSAEIAARCADVGMRAIVLKDHLFPSFTKALLTNDIVPGIDVYGGITLNSSAGGLSLRSVKAAIAAGTKVVMFPTFDSLQNINREWGHIQILHYFDESPEGILVSDENGELTTAAVNVLKEVAKHPEIILSSGHLGAGDTRLLSEAAKSLGISRVMIEHPNSSDEFSIGDMKAYADNGALLNLSFNAYHPSIGARPISEAADIVKGVGAEHCTLITDGGQLFSPWPHDTYRMFCEMLLKAGVPEPEIHLMTKDNPASLIE